MARFTDEELKCKVQEGFIVESEADMTESYKKSAYGLGIATWKPAPSHALQLAGSERSFVRIRQEPRVCGSSLSGMARNIA